MFCTRYEDKSGTVGSQPIDSGPMMPTKCVVDPNKVNSGRLMLGKRDNRSRTSNPCLAEVRGVGVRSPVLTVAAGVASGPCQTKGGPERVRVEAG